MSHRHVREPEQWINDETDLYYDHTNDPDAGIALSDLVASSNWQPPEPDPRSGSGPALGAPMFGTDTFGMQHTLPGNPPQLHHDWNDPRAYFDDLSRPSNTANYPGLGTQHAGIAAPLTVRQYPNHHNMQVNRSIRQASGVMASECSISDFGVPNAQEPGIATGNPWLAMPFDQNQHSGHIFTNSESSLAEADKAGQNPQISYARNVSQCTTQVPETTLPSEMSGNKGQKLAQVPMATMGGGPVRSHGSGSKVKKAYGTSSRSSKPAKPFTKKQGQPPSASSKHKTLDKPTGYVKLQPESSVSTTQSTHGSAAGMPSVSSSFEAMSLAANDSHLPAAGTDMHPSMQGYKEFHAVGLDRNVWYKEAQEHCFQVWGNEINISKVPNDERTRQGREPQQIVDHFEQELSTAWEKVSSQVTSYENSGRLLQNMKLQVSASTKLQGHKSGPIYTGTYYCTIQELPDPVDPDKTLWVQPVSLRSSLPDRTGEGHSAYKRGLWKRYRDKNLIKK